MFDLPMMVVIMLPYFIIQLAMTLYIIMVAMDDLTSFIHKKDLSEVEIISNVILMLPLFYMIKSYKLLRDESKKEELNLM